MNAASRCARCGSGISFCGSFGAPATTKSGARVATGFTVVFAAVFGAGFSRVVGGFGAAGAAAGAGAGVGLGRPIGCTDVPKYGETSSGSPFSGYDVR